MECNFACVACYMKPLHLFDVVLFFYCLVFYCISYCSAASVCLHLCVVQCFMGLEPNALMTY